MLACQQTSNQCSRSARCPGTEKAIILGDYPGTWAEARVLAGLDWDPVTTEVYAIAGINPDGTPHYEPIEGWKSICRSDTGAVLSLNKDSYTVIGHGEMGEIVEAVLAQPNINGKPPASWTAAGPSGAWRCSTSPSPCPATTARRCRTWRSPTGTTAPPPAPCAPPPSASCAPTPSAPPNWKASGPAPRSPSSTSPAGGSRIEEARQAVTGARTEMRRYTELAHELLGIRITPRQRELFVTEFIPMPPQGLITDRVAHNVEEARQALRLIFESKTTEQVAGTAYGLMQAAGEYLDHVRGARSWETRLNRTLIRPEPLKHRALSLIREVVSAA